ncbi:unnamed protein product, partial [Mesorhabditis spiculigera]
MPRSVYLKPTPPKPKKPKKPNRDQLVWEFITSTLDKGIEGLRKEFNRNPRIYDTAKCTVSCRNPKLNRYKDISCHDHSRVHVVGANPDEYIHANYVGVDHRPKRFICTQGPMETTCADFWMMVIQQNVKMIAMLCEFVEQNRPSDRGPIVVTNIFEEDVRFTEPGHAAQVRLRIMTVQGLNTETDVKHYHWANWPDRGAPPPNQDPINLLNDLRCSNSSPIVLHCSAGIGRAGAFALMRAVMEKVDHCKAFNVEDLLKEMRQCRAGLVQTPHQYYYVHAALLKYLAENSRQRERL